MTNLNFNFRIVKVLSILLVVFFISSNQKEKDSNKDIPKFSAKDIHDMAHFQNQPKIVAALPSKVKKYMDRFPEQPKLITINVWNEWVVGNYLLLDMLNGYDKLDVAKSVIHYYHY